MISILNDRKIFVNPFYANMMVTKLVNEKYKKAIPVLEDIAYNHNLQNTDSERWIKIALVVIDPEGADIVKRKFIEWENLPETNPLKKDTPPLWPLGYSRDSTVLPIAWRHVHSERIEVKAQALGVLASLGAKLTDKEKKILRMPKKAICVTWKSLMDARI